MGLFEFLFSYFHRQKNKILIKSPLLFTVPLVSQEVAQKMIGELCSRTNLRPDWAQKCLEEHKWNLDLAVAMFQITKNEGKIPQEAYAFAV